MATRIRMKQRAGPYTFDDFCEMFREDQKADLIDGVIYMASPENPDANELFLWLASIMSWYARKKKLGKVYGSRVAFKLDEEHGPEPDIAFILSEHLDRVKRGRVEGPADLAVEIVSPESVERDYDRKRELYEEHGIPEYWIIDEMEEKVTLFRLKRGKYHLVRPKKGEFHSEVLSGFWLRPEWLWQNPRPDEIETVQQILARAPQR
jgi:Uma2 family endonuclease